MTAETIETPDIKQLAGRLVAWMAQRDRVVVAFSGGVDSAVAAAAAREALGAGAIAVMASSPSVPARQVEVARAVASEIGIPLEMIETGELNDPAYVRNDTQRCFYCKRTLYDRIAVIAARYHGQADLVSGTNVDDLGDYRPGIRAGQQAGVYTPLADLGITKTAVRSLARHWRLSVWDRPAGPCLSSRIAYGESVTAEKLAMIDAAENWLEDHGFPERRVRLHADLHARIEVPADRIGDLVSMPMREILNVQLRSLGFQFVSVDTEGLRSGSFNQLVQIDIRHRAEMRK